MLDDLADLPNLWSGESSAVLQSDGVKPELRDPIVAFDVNVDRLISIPCKEEKAIRSDPQDGRLVCTHLKNIFSSLPNIAFVFPP